MRIAICFFGITRSLKYTINHINKHIFNVFKQNNIEYDTYVHTYYLERYFNRRAGERLNKVDNNEYKMLKPDYLQIDNQNDILKKLDVKQYRTHRDPWTSGYNCVDNFILAQYSKLQLVKMIKKGGKQYDYILYMRPDCDYLHPFILSYFDNVDDNTICIPNFHNIGPHKFNDRFCITNMNTYKLYGNVFHELLDISRIKPLHSETVLGELMVEKYNLNIKRVLFNFIRVRCNGQVPRLDIRLLKK